MYDTACLSIDYIITFTALYKDFFFYETVQKKQSWDTIQDVASLLETQLLQLQLVPTLFSFR